MLTKAQMIGSAWKEIKASVGHGLMGIDWENSDRTWSEITKRTPILIIAPTGVRPVSGSDVRIRQGDQQVM